MVRNHPVIASIVVIIAAVFLFKEPVQAADATAWGWDKGSDAVSSVITYLTALFNR